MKSIQTKFILLITSALLSLALLVGGFSMWNTRIVVEQDAELTLDAVCTEQALKLDMQLQRIEQSVNAIYHFVDGEINNLEDFEDEDYVDELLGRIERLSYNVACDTNGAMAVYFRFNPELTDAFSGFFLVKNSENGVFRRNELTDISIFAEDDVEHVGWYYQPKKEGKPIWMSPYYNQNIGVEMISYVTPLFFKGDFVGVVGMDIDFAMFVSMVENDAAEENRAANLVDMDDKLVYYHQSGDGEATVHDAPISSIFYQELKEGESNEGNIAKYISQNVEYKLAYRTVENGMKYILYSPVQEINRRRNEMVLGILGLTLFILLVFIVYTVYMTRQIIRPLQGLNEAAKKIAEGDLNVSIECKSKDEVNTLTNSINIMVGKLKKYISEVNEMAYRDGLTGVKNKAYYLNYKEMVEEAQKKRNHSYALILFDVNDLKNLNDNYGHEAGDVLIQTASSYICRTFIHSPVFRIGGDEFLAILEGEDYKRRQELANAFEMNMEKLALSVEPFTPIEIAFGMVAQEGDMDFDEVFRQADSQMYEKKKAMKGGEKPR